MPDIDASIPLRVKVPDTMSTIGSMVDMARGVQAFQTGKSTQQTAAVAAQQAQGALDARQNIGKVLSDPNLRDPDTGLSDLNRLWPALQQADPNGYLRDEVFGKIANVNSDMMKVKSLGMALGDQATEYGARRLMALSQDPAVTKGDVNQALDDWQRVAGTGAPAIKPMADIVKRTIGGLDRPETVGPTLAKIAANAFPMAARTPQVAMVPNGQQTVPVPVNPLAPPAQMPPPVQQQLPPATPVFNPNTNTPGYLGAQPQRVAPVAPAGGGGVAKLEVTQPSHHIQSGPALGVPEQSAGLGVTAAEHYRNLTKNADTAPSDIGIAQNIIRLVPGAIKGVGSDKRAIAAGVAGLLGVTEEQLAKTKTDELLKNVNMLASQTPANTDAYRALIEGSRPNGTMTEDAMISAAHQVIAQRQLALIAQKHMGHFVSASPQAYTNELANFNSFADARAVQFPSMSAEEKRSMWQSMSPAEREQFGSKLSKLQSYGYIK